LDIVGREMPLTSANFCMFGILCIPVAHLSDKDLIAPTVKTAESPDAKHCARKVFLDNNQMKRARSRSGSRSKRVPLNDNDHAFPAEMKDM
ncbi:MAG: hypothetical protein ACR2Q4_17680, partial [Geminicoccaceae bacterium]